MGPPEYTGAIHPEKWLKQIQTCCYLKEITDEQKILRICKFKIDSSIKIPDDIDTLDNLIKALKSHSTFEIFKNTCIERLRSMKYIPEKEGGNTSNFISNFRSLCNDAEINNPEEIKILLINSYSNEFFKNEFIKSVNEINSIDEILKRFSDVLFDELKTIKYNSSLFVLKHVATGKYLSSCNIKYKTGSGYQVVFSGEKLPNANALWTVKCNTRSQREPYQYNEIFYDDTIRLYHKATGNVLYCSSSYKSPTTGHTEANCDGGGYSVFNCINANPTNNNTPYVKSKDVINLKSNNYILRSHDFTFAIVDKTFQEVVFHQERIGGNDEWQIELV